MSFFEERGPGTPGGLAFSPEALLGTVPLVVLRAAATANLTLSVGAGLRAPITSAFVTLIHPGIWVIVGKFNFIGVGADNLSLGTGELRVDGTVLIDRAQVMLAHDHGGVTGVENPGSHSHTIPSNIHRATISGIWVHRKEVVRPQLVEMMAYKTSGGGSSLVAAVDTTITAFTVPASETLQL